MPIPVWLQWVFRLMVGGVFVFFGGSKIYDPGGFANSIMNYQLVPVWGINVMALTLPWLELLAGLVLIVGPWRREAATVSAGMLVMFIVAISSAISRGLDIECGCNITGGSTVSWWLVGIDSGLLLVSLTLIIARPPTPDGQAGFPVESTAPETPES